MYIDEKESSAKKQKKANNMPRGKHCQYSMRTFAMAAATLWNSLNLRYRDRDNISVSTY